MISIYLLYLVKVSFCMGTFYALYHFMFRAKTHFSLNRFYLLYTSLVSFLIPFFQFPFLNETMEQSSIVQTVILPIHTSSTTFQDALVAPLDIPQPYFTISLGEILWTLYLLVVAYFFIKLLRKTSTLFRQIRDSKTVTLDGQKVHQHPHLPNSSFFNFIFIQPRSLQGEHSLILAHELVHARHWHSLDIILVELMQTVFWFNPLLPIIKKELQLLHEYIADALVTHRAVPVQQYISLLISSNEVSQSTFCLNHFNSFLKSRVIMLLRKRKKNSSYISYLLIIPTMLGLVILLSKSMQGSSWLEGFTEELQQLEEQEIGITNSMGDQENELMLVLGNQQFDIRSKKLGAQEMDVFTTISKIRKEEFRSGAALQLVDKPGGRDITEVDMFFRLMGPKAPLSPQTIKIKKLPFTVPEDVVNAIYEGKDDHISISIGGGPDPLTTAGLLLFVEDMNAEPNYVDFGKKKYTLTNRIAESAKRLPAMDLVTYTEMIEILQHRNYALSIDGDKIEIHQPYKLFVLDGKPETRSAQEITRELKRNQKIEYPIVLQFDIQGNQYYASFDDESQPKVTYEDWISFYAVPYANLPFIQATVRTSARLQWGSLNLQSTPKRTFNVYTEEGGWKNIGKNHDKSKEGVKELLKEVPRIIYGSTELQGAKSIKYNFIDHVDVPFTGEIKYTHDIAGQNDFLELYNRLKPRDFLQIEGFYVDGKKVAPGPRFRIVE